MSDTPRIAVMVGSFNPFHIGHLNIANKANKNFDEVWIVFGKNHSKSNPEIRIRGYQPVGILQQRGFRVSSLDGLSTPAFLHKINQEHYNNEAQVTLVRGIRNTTDLQQELTQYRYMQSMDPDINVVSIFCDAELAHVSSTGIRQLLFIDEKEVPKYLIGPTDIAQ